MSLEPILKRADAPTASTWDRESIYPDWDAWQADYEAAEARLPELESFAGRLAEGPDMVARWMAVYTDTYEAAWKLYLFVRLAYVVDTGDVEAKSRLGLGQGLTARHQAASAFAIPELIAIGQPLLQWAETTPELHPYRHYFANLLRTRPHRRSAEVEKLLGALKANFDLPLRTHGELTNADLHFREALDSHGLAHPVQQATIPPTGIQSSDRERRRTAWESFSDGYLSMQNTLASNYLTEVKNRLFLVQARGYESALELMLAPTNLPVEVFHTLIETFQKNLPVWHRYWAARRKLLGVEALHPYDIWAPLVENPPEIPYPQAVDWISAALQPLGEDYVQVLRRACLQDRWVDYAPNAGKMQGAASSLAIGQPPFIYMTYDETLTAMSVLAHELGHSMHTYYTAQQQPVVYNNFEVFSMAAAETASNFNQAMLRAYLRREKADDRTFQIALIEEAMFNFHRYFFLMPTLARFEYEVFQRASRNQPLAAPALNEIMRGYFAEGYGETMADDPARSAITWAQFSHLYSPFYTFQYAVGISAAHALAERVFNEGQPAAQAYRQFLSAGASRYPMELFDLAGVDMRSPAPVEKAFAVLESLVAQLEALAE